ncbi:hypothetical protein BH20CHL6_BH20CHL6_07320 [soil metagenome]
MSDRRPDLHTADQPALDPDEKWGQGVDTSHPVSATHEPIEDVSRVGDVPSEEAEEQDPRSLAGPS